MMYFAKFKIDQQDEINKFLQGSSNGIPANGIHYDKEGNICFIYTSPDQKQQQIDSLTGSIDDSLGKWRAELLGYEVDIAVFRALALKGDKKASQSVPQYEDMASNMRKRIEIGETIRKQIQAGDWPAKDVSTTGTHAPVETKASAPKGKK